MPTVKSALESLPGAAQVKVDLETKSAQVVADPAKFKAEDAIALLDSKGFPKSELKKE